MNDIRKKACSKCGETKSLVHYYYSRADGRLLPECKICFNKRRNATRNKPKVHYPEPVVRVSTNPWENLGWNERPNWHDNKRYIPDAVPTHQYANIKI